jgi:4-carboxymuconolactone decarboxylase
MRAWRKASGRVAPRADADPASGAAAWRARGEATCATVYGPMYDRLRVNIRELHPALDEWMIEEGYGRVLGRPGLDLKRRELCITAVCAATEQDRQLHSHLHGALHAGASTGEVDGALEAGVVPLGATARARVAHLWARVRAMH